MKPNSKLAKKAPTTLVASKGASKRARKTSAQTKAAPVQRKSRVPTPPPPKPPSTAENHTQKRSYWQKNKYYALAFVAALLLFAASAWLVRRNTLADVRHAVLHFINDWPDRLRLAFLSITFLGSSWAAVVGVVAAFVLHLYRLAWRLALSVLITYGLLFLIKPFAPERPADVIDGLQARVAEVGSSFPSAHAAIATVIALTLLPYMPNVWRWFVVGFFVAAVAISRLYLGVQTPLDVMSGVALGVGVVCFWRILPRPVKKLLHFK